MMKNGCVLFLLMLLPLGLFAQSGDYDAALDRYESITAECIRVKQSVASGEKVPRAELARLAGQLNGLKTQLQGVSGQLTAAQRQRVADIRQMYSDGIVRSTAPILIPAIPASPAPLLACPALSSNLAGGCVVASVSTGKNPRPDILLLAEAGLVPDFSAGIRACALYGRWGAYVAGRSNFSPSRYGYECLSDGTVPGGGKIWTSGISRVSRLNLSAGALWHPVGWGSLYGGCGYGRRRLLWQDSAGDWAMVSDRSCSGLSFDAGAIFNYNKLVFSAGASVIPPSSGGVIYVDMTVGVGWHF